MLNTDLLCRPWSCHKARVEGYEPLIHGKVERVARRKHNSWRATAFVGVVPMAFSHHDTKAAAESKCASWLRAYTDVHYISK